MKFGWALASSILSAGIAFAGTVDVTATYRERIAVPPDAVLELKLLDVSRQDVIATVLSEARIRISAVPARAVLSYDDALIREGMSYVVSGAIYDGDAPIFRTTSAYPVLTRGSGNKSEIIMERMSASLSKGRGGPISGVPWAVTEIAGEAIAEDDPPMLTLDGEGRFGFYGGCNRFSGQAEIGEDGTFSMPENFAGTLMACPPEREQLERAVLEAFRTVTAYHREGSGLALQDEAGTTVMRFEERPD